MKKQSFKTLKRWHWSLFVLLLLILAACQNQQPSVSESEVAPFTYTIDETVVPEGEIADKDGAILPLAASQDSKGVQSTFIANQVIFASQDKAALEDFLKRTGGTVIEDNALPMPPAEFGVEVNPEDLKATSYLVQVDPATLSLDDFAANANKAGLGGDFKFSSEAGAKLMALSVAEHAADRPVSLNYLSYMDEVLNQTQECTTGAGCTVNAFNTTRFQVGGSRSNVLGAWQFIAGRSMQRRVRVAIIDTGFWLDQNGQPYAVPGIGTDFPNNPMQYDAIDNDFNVGDTNINACTGGNCHGNGAASVAVALVNNSAGAAGTGGLVSDPILISASRGATLDQWRVGIGIRMAIALRADIISMSFGGPCNTACDLIKSFPLGGGDPQGDAIEQARNAGIILIAAAGNDGQNVDDEDVEPCTLDGVICVGALQNDGNRTYDDRPGGDGIGGLPWASNSGGGVDIWAPTYIPVMPRGATNFVHLFNGTSASAPFIAGIAAMMKAVNPALNSDQVRDILRDTAWRDSPDTKVSHYVNALAAVRRSANNQLFPDSFEASGSRFIPGFYPDLSIHIPADKDTYSFVVPDHSSLALRYSYASQLGVASTTSLRKVSGCGYFQGVGSAIDSANWRADYGVTYLSPGTYNLGFSGTDLTAYNVDWRLAPTTAPAHPIDSFEVHDTFTDNNDFTRAYFVGTTFEQPATLHNDTDVDFYKIEGQGKFKRGKIPLSTGFYINTSDMPVRITLLDANGQEVDVAESDPECKDPFRLVIPSGLFFVKVESLSKGTGWYNFGVGNVPLGTGFLPHAPLKFEIRHGLPFESILTDPAVDYIIFPDGLSKDIVITGLDIHLSLIALDGTIVEEGKPIADVGAEQPFGETLSLEQTLVDEPYLVRLTHRDAFLDSEIEGRLEGLVYRLEVNLKKQ
jgi:Subtilase family